MNPSVDEVCIEDIAQALSMSCRFSGYVKSFYSVAEHCCHVSDLVWKTTKDKQKALDALLHDASEAYLTDVPRPIKGHLTNYMEIEKKAEAVIQDKFNVNPMCGYIKHIDTHICGTEAAQLFLQVPDWVSEYEPISIIVKSWSPATAKREFMNRFLNLMEDV